jgi:hypothetical protein
MSFVMCSTSSLARSHSTYLRIASRRMRVRQLRASLTFWAREPGCAPLFAEEESMLTTRKHVDYNW